MPNNGCNPTGTADRQFVFSVRFQKFCLYGQKYWPRSCLEFPQAHWGGQFPWILPLIPLKLNPSIFQDQQFRGHLRQPPERGIRENIFHHWPYGNDKYAPHLRIATREKAFLVKIIIVWVDLPCKIYLTSFFLAFCQYVKDSHLWSGLKSINLACMLVCWMTVFLSLFH